MNRSDAQEIFSASPQETQACAQRLAEALRGGEIILLNGPLGAGKTCFTRGIAEGLGLSPRDVSSPTFTLMHVLQSACDHSLTLVHVDAYRITDIDELDDFGWEHWVGRPGAVTVIEWASRIEDALPADAPRISVHIDHTQRGEVTGRTIRISEACREE